MRLTTKHLQCLAEVYGESWQTYHPNNKWFYYLKDLVEADLITFIDEKEAPRLMGFGHPSEAKRYLFTPTKLGERIIEQALIKMERFGKSSKIKPLHELGPGRVQDPEPSTQKGLPPDDA